MRVRSFLAWLTWPFVMGVSIAAAAWGLADGRDPGTWVFIVSVLNFNLVIALEALLPRRPGVSLFRDWRSIGAIAHGSLVAGLARPLAAAFTVGFVGWWAGTGIDISGIWPQTWPAVLQVAMVLLVTSAIGYWRHRFHHTLAFLWPYHALHHSAPHLHVLKGNRLHFGEELLRFMITPLPLLLVGAPAEIVLWMTLWSNFAGALAHANIDQRFPNWFYYLVPTIQIHEIHHSRLVAHQLANLSPTICLWDLLFGTFVHPRHAGSVSLGIEGDPVPRGFFAQLLQPLRESWQLLRRAA